MFICFYMMANFSRVLKLFSRCGLVFFSLEKAQLSNFREEHERTAIND